MMDARAVKKARTALGKATSAAIALSTTTSLSEAEAAWSDFLVSASRVYTALIAGSRGHPTAARWMDGKKEERRSDELLRYLHHARNSDEHRIEEITEQQTRLELGAADPAKPFIFRGGLVADGAYTVYGENIFIGARTRLALVPVIDRGVTYSVPSLHLGNSLGVPDPGTAATLGLAYLERLVTEVEAQLAG